MRTTGGAVALIAACALGVTSCGNPARADTATVGQTGRPVAELPSINPLGGDSRTSVPTTPTSAPTTPTPAAPATPTPTSTTAPSQSPQAPTATPRPPARKPSSTPSPTPKPTASPKPPAPPPQPVPADPTVALAAEAVQLVNQARSAAGCGPLTVDDRLAAAAVGHSRDMAERNYFDHTSPEGEGPGERMADQGYPSWSGENIALGYRSAEAVVEGWMNSPGHRANIENCDSKATGMGVVDSAKGLYWTQTFGR